MFLIFKYGFKMENWFFSKIPFLNRYKKEKVEYEDSYNTFVEESDSFVHEQKKKINKANQLTYKQLENYFMNNRVKEISFEDNKFFTFIFNDKSIMIANPYEGGDLFFSLNDYFDENSKKINELLSTINSFKIWQVAGNTIDGTDIVSYNNNLNTNEFNYLNVEFELIDDQNEGKNFTLTFGGLLGNSPSLVWNMPIAAFIINP